MTEAALPRAAIWRRRSSWIHRRDRRGVWFVVPFTAMFLLFLLAPLGYAEASAIAKAKPRSVRGDVGHSWRHTRAVAFSFEA
jgi:hypothetical protein